MIYQDSLATYISLTLNSIQVNTQGCDKSQILSFQDPRII